MSNVRALRSIPSENYVKHALHDAGWQAEHYGAHSDALRRTLWGIDTPLRWTPDLIATNGEKAVLVEVKEVTDASRDCWFIEMRSLTVAADFDSIGIEVIFAMVEPSGEIDFIPVRALLLHDKKPGPITGNGSGTPYWIIKKTL